jgi:hypothetical protein
MKTFFVVLLLPTLVLADFRYESTTRMTGGTIMKLPFGKKPEPTTTTHFMKGGRMATVSKDSTTVFDFDKQLYTVIDTTKKQYWQMTFAEMQQAMADMQLEAENAGGKSKGKDIKTEWKMDLKATGVEKDVNGFLAKQVLMTMDMVATASDGKEKAAGSMRMSMDMWNSETVPGYSEYVKFYERLKDKGAWLNPQQWRQSAGPNGMGEGLRKMSEEMMKVKGLPVLSITRVGMAGMGDMSSMGGTQSSGGSSGGNTSTENNTNVGDAAKRAGGQAAGNAAGRSIGGPVGGMLGGALGGKFGGFGRKKPDEAAAKKAEEEAQRQAEAAKAQQAEAEANARQASEAAKADPKGGMMIMTEMVTDASGFSTAPIGEEVFAIPAGFTKVEAEWLKRKR